MERIRFQVSVTITNKNVQHESGSRFIGFQKRLLEYDNGK